MKLKNKCSTQINEPFTLSSRYNAAQFLMAISLLYQNEQINLSHLKDLMLLILESQSSSTPINTRLLDAIKQ